MHFAIFIDDLLGRKSIILKDELTKDALEHFDADSWEEALTHMEMPGDGYRAAFICLPIHAAYLTYIDNLDIKLIVREGRAVSKFIGDDKVSLIYDPGAMKNRKMLNREIREDGILKDIIAGDLVVIPEEESDVFTKAYDMFGQGQVFIYDNKQKDIKTVKCSSMALAVLRENNISIIA